MIVTALSGGLPCQPSTETEDSTTNDAADALEDCTPIGAGATALDLLLPLLVPAAPVPQIAVSANRKIKGCFRRTLCCRPFQSGLDDLLLHVRVRYKHVESQDADHAGDRPRDRHLFRSRDM